RLRRRAHRRTYSLVHKGREFGCATTTGWSSETMYQEVSMQWSNRIRRLAITLVASAAIETQDASAGSSNNIVLVRPAGLPEWARKAGEAMFLREAHDGRTVLYIEQDQGTALAILDV